MKKFTKICIVVIVLCLVLGMGFFLGGTILGARMDQGYAIRRFLDNLDRSDGVTAESEDHEEDHEDYDEEDHDGEEHGEHQNTAVMTVPASGKEIGRYKNVSELSLKAGRTSVFLVPGDGDDWVIEAEHAAQGENPSAVLKGDHLKIRNEFADGTFTPGAGGSSIIVRCPADISLRKLELEMGGGELRIDVPLQADELEADLGASVFESSQPLTARKASLKVGVGTAEIASIAGEKLDFDCGVGSIQALIDGDEKDYDFEAECGMGELVLGSHDCSGIREKEFHHSGSSGKIDASCGMGSVVLRFAQ